MLDQVLYIYNTALSLCYNYLLQGVTEVLCEACDQLGWKSPTKIQIEAIPVALQGETFRLYVSKDSFSAPLLSVQPMFTRLMDLK